MLFVVRFIDMSKHQSIREKNLPAHIEWLAEHRKNILVAGSLREFLEADPVGGLWIVDAENKSQVENLYKTDPFWINGLRKTAEILHWSKAFPDEKVPV